MPGLRGIFFTAEVVVVRLTDGRASEGVVCGPGGEFNSMPDERVRKRQFLECVALYIHVICEICTLDSIDGATA